MLKFYKLLFVAAAISAFAACKPPTLETSIGFVKIEGDSIYSVKVNNKITFSTSVDVINPKGSTSFRGETPEWLTLTSSENTATFVGIPTEIGLYKFTLTATNNRQNATREISIEVLSEEGDYIYYVKVNNEINFSVSVDVLNPNEITSFTAQTPEWLTLTSSENTATFQGTPTEIGLYKFSLTATNNSKTLTKQITVVATSDAEVRTLLFEEFTGDQCVYCPWGAEAFEASIDIPGYEDRVIMVSHHVGYNEDKFTIAASRPLTFYYGFKANGNPADTYAPAAMLDRRIVKGSVPVLGSSDVTKNRVKAQLDKPSYVKINLSTTYNDATSELTVDVSGVLGNYYPNAKLNVYIIQEGLTGTQTGPVDANGNYVTYAQYQQGASASGGTLTNYQHKHALRATLTGNWGDALDVEVGNFSKQYTYTIPENIKGVKNVNIPTDANNMYVVAFVADYIKNTKENLDKSEVHNAAIKKIVP